MDSSGSLFNKALLFIPDISGFTHFIGDRDFQHGQHIIAELLEVLIENNPLGLRVSEVEGDAIFFYQIGNAPDIRDLIGQSEQMYLAFHTHLKKYGVSRLCNCPTCQSASRLTLKFVAHYGVVSLHPVKEHQKLFGSDVILVHRLLKNNVPEREYLLFTENVLPTESTHETPGDMNWRTGRDTYDLGEVKFSYSPLTHWYANVPEPVIPEPVQYRSRKPLHLSVEINATMEDVYDSLIDLNQRPFYMKGLQKVDIRNQEVNRLNRICTTFKCSMEHEKCTFETSGVEREDNRVTFSETLKQHPMTYEYVLERKNDSTVVSMIIHQAFKVPINLLYHLVIKRKILSEANQTLQQLKVYCEAKAIHNH